jgi:hypothetical protein
MSAAIGTLAFLATLWLLAVVGAAILEESGAKIAAALKGPPFETWTPVARFARSERGRGSPRRLTRAEPRWRAAA